MNFKKLTPNDIVVICFYLFLSTLNVIFFKRINFFPLHLLLNSAVIFFVIYIANNSYKNKYLQFIHFWYVVPMIFITFKELYNMIYPIHQRDYDQYLIAIDRVIFQGHYPTQLISVLANPILTEILQICYFSFYFLMITVGAELVIKKRHEDFDYSIFSIVYGFFLSYLGYFLLPCIGPRFTLHNFASTNLELPGLFITNFLREIINAGESIPSGTINPQLIVQRDVFPSGHTQMTLICMYLATKFNLKSKYVIYVFGSLLIFSTIYLRYHYFVDLIGGTVFFLITIFTGKRLFPFLNKFRTNNAN